LLAYSITKLRLSHVHNTTNAVTSLHIAEGLVDLVERLPVRDELVNIELAVHVVLYKIGQLRAAFDTAKSTTLPNAASDELECYATYQYCGV